MSTGDWSAIATAVMALATLFLACRTGSMAKATKKMVDETKAVSDATLKEAKAVEQQTQHIERQVRISSDALQPSVQPWLIRVPSYQDVGPGNVFRQQLTMMSSDTFVSQQGNDMVGRFVIRNVGTGIAFVNLKDSSIFNAKNPDTPFVGIHP